MVGANRSSTKLSSNLLNPLDTVYVLSVRIWTEGGYTTYALDSTKKVVFFKVFQVSFYILALEHPDHPTSSIPIASLDLLGCLGHHGTPRKAHGRRYRSRTALIGLKRASWASGVPERGP